MVVPPKSSKSLDDYPWLSIETCGDFAGWLLGDGLHQRIQPFFPLLRSSDGKLHAATLGVVDLAELEVRFRVHSSHNLIDEM